MEKSKRIKKEERRLNGIFADVDENKKETVEGLIKRAAFMRATLEDFEADLYNTMNTGYQKIIKQMTDLLPEKDRDKDELLDFLGGDRG